MTDDIDRPQFSVCVFFPDGMHQYFGRLISIEQAVRQFNRAVELAECLPGTTARVILTDGGDCVAREWTAGKGITIGDGK